MSGAARRSDAATQPPATGPRPDAAARPSATDPLLAGVDAILFDLDGVLVDSGAAVARAWEAFAAAHGLDPAAVHRAAQGRPTRETVAEVTPHLDAAGLPAPAVLVTSDQLTRGKPDPEGYLLAARLLGADPARCLVVEDAPAGIAAGVAAGARVLALRTTHADADLTAATAVADDLRRLA